MNNYNKNEKGLNKKQFISIARDSTKIIIKTAKILFELLIIGLLLAAPDNRDILFTLYIIISILSLYLFWLYLCFNVDGEFKYNHETLHYTGYNISAWPSKKEAIIPFNSIKDIKIYSYPIRWDRAMRIDYFDKLIITKSDCTKIELNIEYFNTKNIAEAMFQSMLNTPIPVSNPEKFKIKIINYKHSISGYLKLDIYVNEKHYLATEETFTIDVRTGDLLAIAYKSHMQILRLTNSTIYELWIDDLFSKFDIIVKKR